MTLTYRVNSALVAQWPERQPCKLLVASSNLAGGFIIGASGVVAAYQIVALKEGVRFSPQLAITKEV